MSGTVGRAAPTAGHEFEVRRYTDGWLHFYRPEEVDSGRELLTPVCAELDPFYGVVHERERPVRRVRGEVHPACLLAMLAVPDPPVPVPRRPSLEDTVVLPVVVGAFRGQLTRPKAAPTSDGRRPDQGTGLGGQPARRVRRPPARSAP